ncbi:P-loop NTPase fold protein [Nocardioides albus]|uniref:WD40 repeat protein n=1 Tax=Nocardioides albus TaxID=1841 RepID=A0A7W5A5Q5_9ACTN|nr:P-loop NTPase fold protein [Nocardioides albus]MBB3089944.1 WD40 repeat protein [Nocardioides albus]GGU36725.1 hypothetical protein GCM10007979_39890 [Nocardioides albus]
MRGKSGPESSRPADQGWRAKRAIALTTGGRLLASGDTSGSIHLFRTGTGHRRAPLQGHHAAVNALTFSPDGTLLGSVGNDRRAILWNLRSERNNDGLDLGGATGLDIEICPDGRLLAVACDDGKVRIWDIGHVAEQPRWVLDTGSPSRLRSLSVGPNGVPLVAGGEDGRIWVWDNARDRDQSVRTLGCIDWKVHEVALVRGRGQVVSASEDRAIRIWDLSDGTTRILENPSGWVRTVAVTDTHIYAGSDDGKVREWDLDSGAAPRVVATYYPFVYSIAASQDGSVLVVVPGGRLIVRHRGGRERTLHEPNHVWSTAATVFPQRNVVVAGAEDGTYVVSGPNHRTMRIPAHETILRSLDAAPKRDQLASGGDDGKVILWNVATGREERRFRGLSSAVQTLSFSPDGRMLAVGDRMGQLTVWNLAGGEDPIPRKLFENWLLGIAWSKDGQRVVACGDSKISFVEVATGKAIESAPPLSAPATLSAVAFGDNGLVAVGDRIGWIHLFDETNGSWRSVWLGSEKWVRSIRAIPGSADFVAAVGGSIVHVEGGGEGEVRFTEIARHTSPVLCLSPEDPDTGSPCRGVVAVFGDGAIRVVPVSSGGSEWAEEEALSWLAAVVTKPRYGLVDNDQPSKADHLGLDADLRTLAHIMAASSTEPPLAIALLGMWGSGKTTFIEHLEKTIRALVEAEERDPTGAFVQNVRYVGFNAWDYSDRTALVGMVIEIFRDLRAQSEVSEELPDIADPKTWRERVESARVAVEWQEKVSAETNFFKRAWLRIRGANPLRPGFGRWTTRLAGLLLPLGVLAGVATLFWSFFAPQLAKAVPGVASGVPEWAVGVALSGAVGAIPAAFVRAIEVSKSVDESVTWAANWIRSKDGDALRRAKLALAELDPMTRISELLHDATMEEQRSKHRGVVGDLHDQLRALSEALSEAKRGYESDAGDSAWPSPPIQRIFMFVDDLDRCEPHQVVDVLQAVHLLQATGLFVVLVAVDPRWLETSLRKHRPEAYETLDVNQSIIHRVGDPLDFLTKIFQIPFALPQDRGGNYLIELADAARARQPRSRPSPTVLTPDDVMLRNEKDLSKTGQAPSESPAEAKAASGSLQGLPQPRRTPELPAEALTVSEDVARYLNSIARYFSNPRSAKRLINLFQTIRIHQIFAASRDIARDPSMYMPIGGLLGLVVGIPSLSEEVLLAGRVAERGTPIAEVIDGVRRKHVEHMERRGLIGRRAKERHTPLRCDTCRVWDVVKKVIDDVTGHHDIRLSVDEFLPWIDLVARFGFHKDLVWHTALSATTGEGIHSGSALSRRPPGAM